MTDSLQQTRSMGSTETEDQVGRLFVWFVEFPGHYLGGHCIVVAKDEEDAERRALAACLDRGLEAVTASDLEVKKVDAETPGVTSFYDGDY